MFNFNTTNNILACSVGSISILTGGIEDWRAEDDHRKRRDADWKSLILMTLEICSKSGTPFCPECGSLIALPDYNPIKCELCPFSTTYEEISLPTIVTRSVSRPTPSWAVDNLAEKDARELKDRPARMTTAETCPKCNHPELEYYTMQTRSADEGQTVFYECPKCKHTFSVNNW